MGPDTDPQKRGEFAYWPKIWLKTRYTAAVWLS